MTNRARCLGRSGSCFFCLLSFFFVAATLAACGPVGMVRVQHPLPLVAPAGRALVVFIEPEDPEPAVCAPADEECSLGGARAEDDGTLDVDLLDAGRVPLGTLTGGGHLAYAVAPGEHVFVATTQGETALLPAQLTAGRVYYALVLARERNLTPHRRRNTRYEASLRILPIHALDGAPAHLLARTKRWISAAPSFDETEEPDAVDRVALTALASPLATWSPYALEERTLRAEDGF